MADIKISDLPAAASASGAMQIEVNDGGTSRRVTGSQLGELTIGTADGFVVRTGAGPIARAITAGAGIVITNGNGVAGSPTAAVDDVVYYDKTQVNAIAATKASLAGAVFTGPVALDDGDKGTVTSGTVTFDYASKQNWQITINGAVTFAFSNLPTDGSGEMKIQILYTSGSIAFPTIKWAKGDGTKTTTFADLGITLTAGEAYELIVRYVRGQLQGVFG